MSSNLPTTTKQWSVEGYEGPLSLKYTEAPIPELQDNEVLVQIRGASLNPRDLIITKGKYPWTVKPSVIPGSDGAGTILAVGKSANRFKPGDNVITTLNQQHISGPITEKIAQFGTGASIDGVFRQFGVFDERGLVGMPAGLSFVEAAMLSCAGVTAWNALFGGNGGRKVGRGEWVLTQGTGGVSLFAVQFAKSVGARVIATTSSAEKVSMLKSLGAEHVINYCETPNWGPVAKQLTGGVGVDLVVDVAGPSTLRESAESLKLDGQISVVGFIGGEGGEGSREMPSLLETWLNLYTARGIWVGSRVQMEEMCRAIAADPTGLRPVVNERVFKLHELREAYEYLAEGRNQGKIGIEID
ncbi:hypothetical protein BDV12DRAFT_209960 [Aspergillus spectabilis]